MINYSAAPSLLFLSLGSQSCLCPSNLCLCTSSALCDPSQKALLLVCFFF